MATSSPYNGRGESVGVGHEATPGTPVAPQFFFPWNSLGIQPRTTVVTDESSYGTPEQIADSAVTQKWVEGPIGGRVGIQSIGALFRALYGNVTSTGTSPNYTHTFTHNPSSIPSTLTFALISPLQSERYAYGVIDNIEITVESGGYVEVSTTMKARVGVPSSETVAHNHTERDFTSKHVKVRVAANSAGLNAATDLSLSRMSAILERGTEPYFPLGTDSAVEFMKGAAQGRGEFVARLTDTQYETDFLDNVAKALRITIEDGTDSLVLTAGKIRYREIEKTRDQNGVVTATIQWQAEFDPATNAAVVPTLKNSRATYVAA